MARNMNVGINGIGRNPLRSNPLNSKHYRPGKFSLILASPFLNMAGMEIPCEIKRFWPMVAMLGVREGSQGRGGQNTESR